MTRTDVKYMLFSGFLLGVLGGYLFLTTVDPPRAGAAENVVCTLTTSAVAANTSAPTSGVCSWQQGSLVLMQCDQDVYFNANTGPGATLPTAATASSQRINFATGSNFDPYIIYLGTSDKHVSVLQVSVGGTCKFIVSPFRRKPH